MEKLSQFSKQYGQAPFAVLVLDEQLRVLWSNAQAQLLLPFVAAADGLQPLLEESLYAVSCRLQNGDPVLMDAVGLPLLGIVPSDPNISYAAAAGKPLIKYSHFGAAAAAYKRIAKRIMGLPVPIANR